MVINEENLMLPVLATRGQIVFPNCQINLEVGRKMSVVAFNQAQEIYDNHIIIVSQLDPSVNDPKGEDFYKVGTLCKILNARTNPDKTIKLLLSGEQRVLIDEYTIMSGCFYCKAKVLHSIKGDPDEELGYIRALTNLINGTNKGIDIPSSIIKNIANAADACELTDLVAQYIDLKLADRQKALEILNINERIEFVIEKIGHEKIVSEIEQQITKKVKDKLDQNQRDYILREKLKAIKEELGDISTTDSDADTIRKIIEENPYPENIKEKIKEELKKYEMTPSSSPESGVIKNYLDWLIKTPWFKLTEDNDDLINVEKVLDEDHFGLEKPKERIIEYLAVKKLTGTLKAPIICFSGPPGTGKTSLAMSIARALNRKFVKCSLGGISDESEIRGHRRTYIGAMPGRIIQGMKKAGVCNPVFLLDEIDKLGKDYKGDPSSALLEVLDPEQNKAFQDNYLEEPYDLSNVLFICTANYLENIPAPLFDRLEIIELSSYTEEEKLNIAKNHLIKKQAELNGITGLSFTDKALLKIIRSYTREAGVRQLERTIGTIARKVAVRSIKDEKVSKKVGENTVSELLGIEKFDYFNKGNKDQVGVVTGLAYTQYGGDILPIEVVYFNGSGRVILTGNLGDVMKESANIALGYVKAHATEYEIDPDIFNKIDIHISAPEGGIPKDGPSAGVTITTAIISCLSKKKCKCDIAMTGEITLTGNVLAIGGLKEKSIGANRSGIKKIYIPKSNEKNIIDIPETIKKELEIVLVTKVDEIIKDVLY